MGGRKKLFLALTIIVCGLLAAVFLRYVIFRTGNSPTSSRRVGVPSSTSVPQADGVRKLEITSNVGGDPRFAAIGYSILNGLKVVGVDLQSKVLDVVYSGGVSEVTLRVPVVGVVEAFQSNGQELLEQGLANLVSLELKAGQIINMGFIYVKPGYQMTTAEIEILCGQVDYHNCQVATRNGFGAIPTDFEKYIVGLENGKDKTVDIKVAYPTSITKL